MDHKIPIDPKAWELNKNRWIDSIKPNPNSQAMALKRATKITNSLNNESRGRWQTVLVQGSSKKGTNYKSVFDLDLVVYTDDHLTSASYKSMLDEIERCMIANNYQDVQRNNFNVSFSHKGLNVDITPGSTKIRYIKQGLYHHNVGASLAKHQLDLMLGALDYSPPEHGLRAAIRALKYTRDLKHTRDLEEHYNAKCIKSYALELIALRIYSAMLVQIIIPINPFNIYVICLDYITFHWYNIWVIFHTEENGNTCWINKRWLKQIPYPVIVDLTSPRSNVVSQKRIDQASIDIMRRASQAWLGRLRVPMYPDIVSKFLRDMMSSDHIEVPYLPGIISIEEDSEDSEIDDDNDDYNVESGRIHSSSSSRSSSAYPSSSYSSSSKYHTPSYPFSFSSPSSSKLSCTPSPFSSLGNINPYTTPSSYTDGPSYSPSSSSSSSTSHSRTSPSSLSSLRRPEEEPRWWAMLANISIVVCCLLLSRK
eukprot:TRINITY_DN21977_c0_g1_i1.p1 TRINITY_DN21977_c0_g1~~TRINITY_DN21977_c0_g1_i1.p1  ORF type:complete len:480 (-),score=52.33 TRINITY_DN21977_c0_g1_i1:11-1450(-)